MSCRWVGGWIDGLVSCSSLAPHQWDTQPTVGGWMDSSEEIKLRQDTPTTRRTRVGINAISG